jgi:sugar transferase (PEP-CTERM/EpsH1 system associated)
LGSESEEPGSPQLMMNILYLAPCVPYPPNKGEKIRAFHQIRLLSREHTIHLVCVARQREDLDCIKHLRRYCASVDWVYRKKTLPLRILAALTFLVGKRFAFRSRELEDRIVEKLRSEKFDRIYVFTASMAQYVRHVSDIPKVMDFVDVSSELWRAYANFHSFPLSWLCRLKAQRLARYEDEVARMFDHSVFVSEAEADIFRQRGGDRPVSVISNGVDLDYFSPPADGWPRPHLPIIAFTGTMDYFPNVDAVTYFCRQVFPLIRGVLPQAHFYIVGRNPAGIVKKLGSEPQVTVTGSVPDVRPYLARSSVVVAPFRVGRGIQNKILEAMACGIPVVGTTTAFQGLEVKKGDGFRMVHDDNPDEFAVEVLRLLKDIDWWRCCSLKARNYVDRFHRWDDQVSRLNLLLRELQSEPLNRRELSGSTAAVE